MSNETVTLEDVRKQYMERETEQLRGIQNELYNSMMSNEHVYTRPQLPIEVFEQVFLNYFRNLDKNQEDNHLLNKWLEIASGYHNGLEISGGYYNEVDLIDTHGNVVLVVPALIPRPEVNTGDLSHHYVTNMGEEIVALMKHSKIAAENKMKEIFSTLPHVFNNDNHLKDAELKWRAIFAYFSNDSKDNTDSKNNNEGIGIRTGDDDKIQHFSDEIGIEYD